jgi:DNA recombination protein RmuC
MGIIAAAALVTVWALTHVIVTLRWKGRVMQALSDKRVEEALRKQQEESLQQQMAAVKAEMTARTEEILKTREEELSRKAKETFEGISGGLSRDLSAMKEAFEAGKKSQAQDAAALRERFDAAVRDLEEQSRAIGGKADRLADAMRGQKKLQGCWGETVLANLLASEGLVEGRDYDKESTLRDELGFALLGEDSEKKMRPDFILHLPDNNDIVIDAKVSLSAFSDYVEAEDPEARADAAVRNAAAVREQAKRLARKGYERYLRPGRRMLDYVVMFVPNYPALQLAYTEDPALWRDAYAQGVLITSEETLMPFLRMISIAWTHVEQVRNQQQIIASAQMMIDRVADFAKAHAEMGGKLKDAQECYDRCADKLKDSGRSIVQSARQIVKLGVPANPKKPLPEE